MLINNNNSAFIIIITTVSLLLSGKYSHAQKKHDFIFPDSLSARISKPQVITENKSGSSGSRTVNDDKVTNNSSLIPLDFLYRLNDVSVSDLLLNYVEDYDEDEGPSVIANRFGDIEERDSAVNAVRADCLPELQTVRIAESSDPSVLYVPSCTRIERCGGCCSHNLFSCQPVETETVALKVRKLQYEGGSKLKFRGREIILVEKHTKCQCGCRKKAEECSRYQQYDGYTCACTCANVDEEQKCHKLARKLWDPKSCTCQCRDVNNCTTGLYFDSNECKCMTLPHNRVVTRIGPAKEDGDPQLEYNYYQTEDDSV